MLFNDRRLSGAAAVALMLGGCGFGGRSDDARPEQRAAPNAVDDPSIPSDEIVKIGDPYTIAGQRFEPKDDITFDEVGYATIANDGRAGGSTSNGETYRPEAITIAHRILPIPSYVELTNLETGKTILARVNDRGPMSKDRVAELSFGAARALGIDGLGSTSVRVRRTNPPVEERIALRMGGEAPARLDTPPALLSALRRRLGETNPTKPRDAAVGPPPRVAAVKPVPKPRPLSTAVARPMPQTRAGADFDQTEPAAPTRVPARVPVRAPAPAATRSGNDRFIVEGGQGRPAASAPRAPRAAPPVAAAPMERPYYIQVASFSDEGRARKLAGLAGGKVEKAGTNWRVRMGPYDSEAAAKAALSQVVNKGYRDARIAH
jgi:rare lipoprotein A